MEQKEMVPAFKKPRWLIRDASPTDLPFIYATWLNSYWKYGKKPSGSKTEFFESYRKIVDFILLNSKTFIASLPDSENTILGYICFDNEFLHYVFVKEDFQSFGIAKDLYHKADCPHICTHSTRITIDLISKLKLHYSSYNLLNLLLYYAEQGEI